MYKDQDKQKEANRLANKRYRERKGITQKVSRDEGITQPEQQGITHAIHKVAAVVAKEMADAEAEGHRLLNEIKDMTRRELYDAIHAYPNDQWINSPEHKELMSRLISWTVDRLEEEGYFIPAWKRCA
jgi:hypothetical protein